MLLMIIKIMVMTIMIIIIIIIIFYCQAKEEGTMVLINGSDYIPSDTASHSIKFESSAKPLS